MTTMLNTRWTLSYLLNGNLIAMLVLYMSVASFLLLFKVLWVFSTNKKLHRQASYTVVCAVVSPCMTECRHNTTEHNGKPSPACATQHDNE